MRLRGLFIVLAGLVLGGCVVFGDHETEVVVWDFTEPRTAVDLGGELTWFYEVDSRGDVDITVTFPNGRVYQGLFGSVIAFAPDVSESPNPTLINDVEFHTSVHSAATHQPTHRENRERSHSHFPGQSLPS